jgi:superfamily II DNA or RNA helicase
VQHSKNVAADFNAAGIPAQHVDGTTPADERRQAMEDFRAGRVLVLTNCNLFVEGVDVPALETCILLRPTRSLSLYLQAVGRALRPAEGKTAIILDHVGACAMHGFPDDPHEWTLWGRANRKATYENDPAPAIRICDQCYAAYKPALYCPYCGEATKPTPREIEQREGELAEIKRIQARKEARQSQGRAQSLPELIAHGKQMGYKNPTWWARKVYNGRIGKGVTV